jgi:chemotaxis protein MotA
MKHLDHLEDVGRGIAVAFVATVYGVGLANLVLLPIAAKILALGRKSVELHELILAGVLSIAAGTNPRLMQLQLGAYRSGSQNDEANRPAVLKPERVAQIG